VTIRLQGEIASRGIAEGRARWVQTEDDLYLFQRGEIILAKWLPQNWVTVHPVAIATEVGDTLSHAAMIAREFGIPAIVGIGPQLSTIATGCTVIVNGNEGTVTVKENT
jgi:phosphoenolpyruvate-protein kinase (PTS system EI component)